MYHSKTTHPVVYIVQRFEKFQVRNLSLNSSGQNEYKASICLFEERAKMRKALMFEHCYYIDRPVKQKEKKTAAILKFNRNY